MLEYCAELLSTKLLCVESCQFISIDDKRFT